MAAYVTEANADIFVAANIMDSVDWDAETSARKDKALLLATNAIDNLNYLGEKTVAAQANQFPRGEDTVVPTYIEEACIHIAIRLVEGIDIELEFENARMTNQQYGNVRSAYNTDVTPEHLIHGIPSMQAWLKLKPYLREIGTVDMRRV
jgi:hypothetical protein